MGVLYQWRNQIELLSQTVNQLFFIFYDKIALQPIPCVVKIFIYLFCVKIFIRKILAAKVSVAKMLTMKIPDTSLTNNYYYYFNVSPKTTAFAVSPISIKGNCICLVAHTKNL